ncbi:hypothetical protein ACS0TY_003508 [Phlomoides rotata]
MEEKELGSALKELVLKGYKCDNGFKSGYLLLLENMIARAFPGCDLKGEPLINSKIHVWKKQYACLKIMLGKSGIGLNSTTYRIDALPDVWEAHIKVDPTAKSLKNKTFPFYSDWLEIFGNDRAMGHDSQVYVDAVHEVLNHANRRRSSTSGLDEAGESTPSKEHCPTNFSSFTPGDSSSASKDKGKGLKRKQIEGIEVQMVEAIGNLSDKAESRFGQIAENIGSIAKRVGSEIDACEKRGQVYDRLGVIDFITMEERFLLAQHFCNNTKDMDLFVSLPDDAKTLLVHRILKKISNDDIW